LQGLSVQTVAFVEARQRLEAVIGTALERAPSRRVLAGACSALLHLALLIAMLSLNVRSGDPTALPTLFVEDFSPRAPRQISEHTPLEEIPPLAAEAESTPPSPDLPKLAIEPEIDAAIGEQFRPVATATLPTPTLESEIDEPSVAFVEDQSTTPAPPMPPTIDVPRTRQVEIAPTQQATLIDRITQAAQALVTTDRAEVAWQEDGREYRAVLKREVTADSMELEQIAAEVTTTNQGSSMQTELLFSRLAFSQFTQVVDRWDQNVQLHDDEIVGRFHSNSAVFVGATGSVTPKFTGKVTTAARNLRFAAGSRRRQAEMFQGGLQTSAGRIDFPKRAPPFALEPPEKDAHVQRFDDDAHIILAKDGRYSWQERRADVAQQVEFDADRPLYLLAGPKATLYVRGVVDGRVLVYSPNRIVIEGNLVYADDARDGDSDDYLGLVSDGNVEIARPYVTGRGDLRIDAAIFARRNFIVTDIDKQRGAAKLWIYGSLTAGTLSASEPRYGTKIEFDPRFDRVRPPGFPSTNRFELASWDPSWREVAETTALDSGND
jgi:hypothetical protein